MQRRDDIQPDTRGRRIAGALAASVAVTLLVSILATYLLSGQSFPPALDFIALSSGLASAYLIRVREPLGWWIGLATVTATAGSFFFTYDIPGQAWFQLLYALPLQIYGCIAWAGGKPNSLSIGALSTRSRALCLLAYAAGAFGIAGALWTIYGGGVTLHLWDGAIVSGCILAQTLLARRKLEAWLGWIVLVNGPSIALHIHNDAWLYAALYSFFMANALAGLRDWRRIHMSATGSQPAIQAAE